MARPTRATPASAVLLQFDERAALRRVLDLMAIPGPSGEEEQTAQAVIRSLRAAGLPSRAILRDDAHRKSPLGGQCGNLIVQLPGTLKGPRRLLMAHLDTVPLCRGSRPKRVGDFVRSADPRTGLGADNRAGCAVLLTAACEILRRKLPHPPLTFLWCVQEEVGLLGARHAQLSKLARPKLAFNWDGGPASKVTVGATGAYRMAIELHGLASHAGGAPEQGVSAIAVAGLAIARLQQEGWLGDVRRDGCRGTSNIGFIQGGGATNVVTPHVQLRAEARSHDPEFRVRMADAFRQAFEQAAQEVRNVAGVCGRVSWEQRLDYEAFLLPQDEPCVLAAEAAVQAAGLAPLRAVSNGGLDANWLTARGIPTVTLGCGQKDVHTTSEQLDVAQFLHACRVGLLLATGAGQRS